MINNAGRQLPMEMAARVVSKATIFCELPVGHQANYYL